MDTLSRFIGSLVGGALGDALGYPVEFMSLSEIKREFGPGGIKDLLAVPGYGKAVFSDDTQMSLFTADGMIRGFRRMKERGIGSFAASGLFNSYKDWYMTQTGRFPGTKFGAESIKSEPAYYKRIRNLLDYPELYKSRAPGNACMSSIGSGKMGTMQKPINNSKGCGGVMRAAPCGLFLYSDPEAAFITGCEMGAITHGHPSGYLAAGAMSAIIAFIVSGSDIEPAAIQSMEFLKKEKYSSECVIFLDKALSADRKNPSADTVSEVGAGWVAEEALAVGVYCALCYPSDFRSGAMLSVNHSGDSDSTGSVYGNIVGAFCGIGSLPEDWISKIELYQLIDGMAEELYSSAKEFHGM